MKMLWRQSMTETAKQPETSAGPAAAPQRRVLLVTGMSGAGKTAALKALEDLGYEAVDNLPLSLLASLIQPARAGRPLAMGVDIRTRDFGVGPFVDAVDRLIAQKGVDARLLFLDCEDETLRRRYTETRRRHPLAGDRPLMDGIRHERRLVSTLRDRADVVVDTTDMVLADLQRILRGNFGLDEDAELTVFVTSFSFRQGLPREADLVLDVRFLANPHYEPALSSLTGEAEEVGRFVRTDPGYQPFFESLSLMLTTLLPRYRREGKSYLTIAIGCTGGRHRSVFVAEQLTAWLWSQGEIVEVSHRDLPGPRR